MAPRPVQQGMFGKVWGDGGKECAARRRNGLTAMSPLCDDCIVVNPTISASPKPKHPHRRSQCGIEPIARRL